MPFILSCVQLFAQFGKDTVRTIKIDVLVGLQYDLLRFNVKPGERLKIIFSNGDDMSHNLLITKPGNALHPYIPVSPYFYRVFIDGSSPAAIAVSLPNV